MKIQRWGSLGYLACVVGCASSPSQPQANDDASGSVSDTGSPDLDARVSSDSSPLDISLADRSSQDGPGVTIEDCGRARQDASVPDAPCPSRSDTDGDGLPDCFDRCPYDANKVLPGTCGCGTPEWDSDDDGIPDCMDQCPLDPNNMAKGPCGCVGMPGLQPAGTPCTFTACPQPGAVCDGAGVCGDRSSCNPCPGGHFLTPGYGEVYWFCGTNLPPVHGPGCVERDGGAAGPLANRMAAKSACAAKGLRLGRIAQTTDNDVVRKFLTSRLWLGANDFQTPGEWYWPSIVSDSDALFWSGGPDGSPQNGRYANWGPGAPAGASCASISPVDGRSYDTDCGEMLGYICVYNPLF